MAGRDSLTKLNPDASVAVLGTAARERLLDAEVLLQAGRFASAIAFGLYALEIELKVVICRRLDLSALPIIIQTHDLSGLTLHSGLVTKIQRVKRPRDLSKNWNELLKLPSTDELRYDLDPSWDERKAERVLRLLRDAPNGVLPWLRRQAFTKAR